MYTRKKCEHSTRAVKEVVRMGYDSNAAVGLMVLLRNAAKDAYNCAYEQPIWCN